MNIKTIHKLITNSHQGQSILEVIIAMAVFGLIVSAVITLTLGGFTTLEQGGEQTEAEALVQEGFEAVYAVKTRDWAGVTCTTCVAAISGGEWTLSSGASETIGQYVRTITIEDVYRDGSNDIAVSGTLDDYTKLVTVTVTWNVRGDISNTVTRASYISNWWYSAGGDCLGIDTASACFDTTNSNKDLINITLTNNCGESTTMVSLTPTWNTMVNIENVTIGGTSRWDWQCNWGCTPLPRQNSGTTLDFGSNDVTFAASQALDVDAVTWSGSMSGASVSLTFTFDDDTTAETGLLYPPDCGVSSCAAYCQSLGGYSTGSCRSNTQQCTNNSEVYESSGDLYCTGGASADTCCCLPTPDIIAPSAVSDLAVDAVTYNSADLTWTAPGDDLSVGTATSYDIRYATTLITELNWSSATQVTGEPTPQVAGSAESMTVTGLSAETMYYFAIKTSDEVPNESLISNVTSTTTLAIPTDWSAPSQTTQVDMSGTDNGLKVDVQGDYIYVVRAGGNPDFAIYDVSTPSSPTLMGSMALAGSPYDVAVDGSYAYVVSSDNSKELMVINIADPSNPAEVGSLNLSGNANAFAVEVSGDTVYIARDSSSSAEFYTVSVAVKAAPVLLDSEEIGSDVNDVIVIGNYAYLATDGTELQVINVSNPAALSNVGSLDLSGGSNAESIAGVVTTLLIGRADGTLSSVDITTPTSPSFISSTDFGSTIRDIAINSSVTYAFIASDTNSGEFKVIDISVLTSLAQTGVLNLSADINGIAYDETNEVVYVVGESDTEEIIVIQP